MKEMDELFRSKLEDHAILPSAAAWDRIESGLTGRKSSPVYWRWAAILAVGVILAGIYMSRSSDVKPVAVTAPALKKTAPTENSSTPASQSVAEIKKEKAKQPRKAQKHLEVNREEMNNDQPVTEPVQDDVDRQEQSIAVVELPTAEVTERKKGIVLTYTLEDISAPVVAQEITQPERATATEPAASRKKEKSFKKMVDFARTVKNSDPIGDLRDMKSELFALELKKKSTSKKH